MYVLICTSCADCCSKSVGLFDKYPTGEQIYAAKDLIGSMLCITYAVYEINVGEVVDEPLEL